MKVWNREEDFDLGTSSIALGMFDGVHCGHRKLIQEARRLADELGAACVVNTFDRHPLAVLAPDRAPRQLITPEQKLEIFEKLGVDGVLIRPFTKDFAAIDPEAYLRLLSEAMRARAVVAGFNYTFGAGGRGNARLIEERSAELGYTAKIVDPVTDNGDIVSSTLIRSLLDRGETERAERLLRGN